MTFHIDHWKEYLSKVVPTNSLRTEHVDDALRCYSGDQLLFEYIEQELYLELYIDLKHKVKQTQTLRISRLHIYGNVDRQTVNNLYWSQLTELFIYGTLYSQAWSRSDFPYLTDIHIYGKVETIAFLECNLPSFQKLYINGHINSSAFHKIKIGKCAIRIIANKISDITCLEEYPVWNIVNIVDLPNNHNVTVSFEKPTMISYDGDVYSQENLHILVPNKIITGNIDQIVKEITKNLLPDQKYQIRDGLSNINHVLFNTDVFEDTIFNIVMFEFPVGSDKYFTFAKVYHHH
jgi:hypothetical protein